MKLMIMGVAVVVSSAALEILLWVIAPLPDPFGLAKQVAGGAQKYVPKRFPPDVRMQTLIEEGLPGMRGTSLFTTNSLGFRGDPLSPEKPEGEYRVFMIGGSTTECVYLDDSECLTRRLQESLQAKMGDDATVKVYGAARSGDQTMDHTAILSQLIVHFDPDAVVLYCGINDLYLGIAGHDYFLSPRDSARPFSWRQQMTELQIGRYLHRLVNRLEAGERAGELQAITLRTAYREHVERRKGLPELDKPPGINLEIYRQNLRTIIGIAEAHGIRLFLVTHPSTWNSRTDASASKWNWAMFELPDGRRVTYREEILDEALEKYNDVMRRLADEHDVALVDFAELIPKSSKFFYDHCHFNVEGAKTAGEIIVKHWPDHPYPHSGSGL